jgi:hypothetical protein
MCKAEVECLPAAHRETGNRAVFSVRPNGVSRLDCRDHIFQQVLFKRGECGRRREDVTLGLGCLKYRILDEESVFAE